MECVLDFPKAENATDGRWQWVVRLILVRVQTDDTSRNTSTAIDPTQHPIPSKCLFGLGPVNYLIVDSLARREATYLGGSLGSCVGIKDRPNDTVVRAEVA